MTDIAAFRDYQTRSTIFAERERALDARRSTIQELRQAVATAQTENQSREEHLAAERSRFAQKKAMQDEKVNVKDSQARAQQDRLFALTQEEERLTASIAQCDQQIDAATSELERRHEMEGQLREVKEKLTQLKHQLEDQDAKVMRLETRIARQEMNADKRHTAFAERLPEHWLPRIEEADKSASLEDTAGESVLLVDEMAY